MMLINQLLFQGDVQDSIDNFGKDFPFYECSLISFCEELNQYVKVDMNIADYSNLIIWNEVEFH